MNNNYYRRNNIYTVGPSRKIKAISVFDVKREISTSLLNALAENNIVYLRDVRKRKQTDFTCLPNFGRKTNNELIVLMDKYNLPLRAWAYAR